MTPRQTAPENFLTAFTKLEEVKRIKFAKPNAPQIISASYLEPSMAEEPLPLPLWSQSTKPNYPNMVQSIDSSIVGDTLSTKLKLI
jgi:hypothetical protein